MEKTCVLNSSCLFYFSFTGRSTPSSSIHLASFISARRRSHRLFEVMRFKMDDTTIFPRLKRLALEDEVLK